MRLFVTKYLLVASLPTGSWVATFCSVPASSAKLSYEVETLPVGSLVNKLRLMIRWDLLRRSGSPRLVARLRLISKASFIASLK